MTNEEIQEFNKRCAEFLGWKQSQKYEQFNDYHGIWEKENDGIWYKEEDIINDSSKYFEIKVNDKGLHNYHYILRFNSDWNWIMEIVEKIQTLDKLGGIVTIQQGGCKITSRMAGDSSVYANVSNYFLQGMKGQKEAVVDAINQFLIWYNDAKS